MEEGFDLFLTVIEVNMNAVWNVSSDLVCDLYTLVKAHQRKVCGFQTWLGLSSH